MKIVINRARCVGNARCHAVSSHLYPLDEEGRVALDSFDVPAGEEVAARRGARSCPERIIKVEDDDAYQAEIAKRKAARVI